MSPRFHTFAITCAFWFHAPLTVSLMSSVAVYCAFGNGLQRVSVWHAFREEFRVYYLLYLCVFFYLVRLASYYLYTMFFTLLIISLFCVFFTLRAPDYDVGVIIGGCILGIEPQGVSVWQARSLHFRVVASKIIPRYCAYRLAVNQIVNYDSHLHVYYLLLLFSRF